MSDISFGGGGRGVSFGCSGILNSTSLSSNPLGAPPTNINFSAVSVSDDLVVGSLVATISGNGGELVSFADLDPDTNTYVRAKDQQTRVILVA